MSKAKMIEQLKAVEGIDFDWNRETKELDEVIVHPTVIERDGQIIISGEDGKGFVNYYGVMDDGDPYIHEALNEIAEAHGGYWEWENPGAICFAD